MKWMKTIWALIWPPVPVHLRKTIVYDRYELAQRTAARFDGMMTPEEVMGVWDRHPEFGPGGEFWTESDLAPERSA